MEKKINEIEKKIDNLTENIKADHIAFVKLFESMDAHLEDMYNGIEAIFKLLGKEKNISDDIQRLYD